MSNLVDIHNKLRSPILGVSTFLIGWLVPEMGWVSHSIAAWIIALALAIFADWILTSDGANFVIQRTWMSKWKVKTRIITNIGLCFVIFLTSGIMIMSQPPEFNVEEAMKDLASSFETMNDEKQLKDTIDMIESAQGIIESNVGEPILLMPLNNSYSKLGDFTYGAKQTITGLTVSESPFIIKIPNLLYAMIIIEQIDDSRYQVIFLTTLMISSSNPTTLTVYVESQDDITQIIPSNASGYYKQKVEATIQKSDNGLPFDSQSVVIQMELVL